MTIVLFGSAATLFAEQKKSDRKTEKSKKKAVGKSSKSRFVKKNFRAKKTRTNSPGKFQTPRGEDEFEGDAERREDWFMSKRTYPYAELPADARGFRARVMCAV